jgi:hypothetical protein
MPLGYTNFILNILNRTHCIESAEIIKIIAVFLNVESMTYCFSPNDSLLAAADAEWF